MTELPIVPDGNTAATVTTTVWVGVCIVALFHLRYGWTLSGLVVPGYLVPLLMVRPVSVFVILAEATVTYWVVHAISEWGKQSPYWCTLFGRDRFFAITVVSVLVRVGMDVYLLPVAGQSCNAWFGLNFRYDDELHSVGLVVVALIANYFWKPGLVRGLAELCVTTAATYLVVRYVLVEFTSFDIGNLRYVYEDIAASLLASPKAYIVLLTTAWLASRMNLRYSWDYNGILIPSLLALQWSSPTKILATFVEAFVVLGLSHAALRIPIFRRIGMVGARQLMLFFTIAFAYRTTLIWLIPWFFDDVKASDAHGFGYLLSTLLAMRFYSKGQVIGVSQAALQVSIGGAVAGSLIGFCLLYLPREWRPAMAPANPSVGGVAADPRDLGAVLRTDKLGFYDALRSQDNRPPDSHQCLVFVQALKKLDSFRRDQDPARLDSARRILQRIDYEVLNLGEYLYLRDRRANRNWGAFVLSKVDRNGLVVGVPYPISEPYTLEAATTIFQRLGGGAMAIAHNSPLENEAGDDDSLHHRSLYSTFHRELARRNALQVRSYSDATEKWFQSDDVLAPSCRPAAEEAGLVGEATDIESFASHAAARGKGRRFETLHRGVESSQLWITGGLPAGLDLAKLRSLIAKVQLKWGPSPVPNRFRDRDSSCFAEIFVSARDLAQLFAQGITPADEIESPLELTGSMAPWLLEQKELISPKGSGLYQPASRQELLYLGQEVVRPLIDLARQGPLARNGPEKITLDQQISILDAAAAVLNYRVFLFQEPRRDARYIVLSERLPQTKYWGTCVFRLRPETPFVWQVPHPLFERNTFEFAATSFVRYHSMALLVPGAHRQANPDQTADVVPGDNPLTLFNLVHQSLIHELADDPFLVIQCRAIRDPVANDITIACDSGARSVDELSRVQFDLYQRLLTQSATVDFVDGSFDTAGYELGSSAQLAAMHFTPAKEFMGLWLSPSLRSQFRRQSDNYLLQSQIAAMGIPITDADLLEYLLPSAAPKLSNEDFEALRAELGQFLQDRDIVQLHKVILDWPQLKWSCVIDRESEAAFLIVITGTNQSGSSEAIVVSLADVDSAGHSVMWVETITQDSIDRFIASDSVWLMRRNAE